MTNIFAGGRPKDGASKGAENAFGQYVRGLRIDARISLGDMADAVDLSAPYYSQIETGKKAIPADLADKVADALEVDPVTRQRIRREAVRAMDSYKIDVGNDAGDDDRLLAGALAVSFARLSPEVKDRLRGVLQESGDA